MKKYIITTIILALIITSAVGKSKNLKKESTQVKVYMQLLAFKRDTLEYLRYNFIERKSNYVGKSLASLLADLEIPVKSWNCTGPSSNTKIATDFHMYFDDPDTKNKKVFRDNPTINKLAIIYGISIEWQTPADRATSNNLIVQTQGNWNPVARNYYGPMIIKSIKVYIVGGLRYE